MEETSAGAIIFREIDNSRIYLLLNYPSGHWDFVKGKMEKDESTHQTVIREAKEETGYSIKEIRKLGEIATNSGVTSAIVPVFFARVQSHGYVMQDDTEAIHSHIFLNKKELKQALTDGYVSVEEKGVNNKIPLRDAVLAYALTSAEYQGLF